MVQVVEDVGRHRIPTRALAIAASAVTIAALVVALVSINRQSTSPSPSRTKTESPAMITVPTLVGMNRASAAAAAQQVGLTVKMVEAQSTVAPRGIVIAQQPQAGTSIRHGDAVTVTISSGP